MNAKTKKWKWKQKNSWKMVFSRGQESPSLSVWLPKAKLATSSPMRFVSIAVDQQCVFAKRHLCFGVISFLLHQYQLMMGQFDVKYYPGISIENALNQIDQLIRDVKVSKNPSWMEPSLKQFCVKAPPLKGRRSKLVLKGWLWAATSVVTLWPSPLVTP